MKAMILAAGRGERMRPLTDHTPKPLLQYGGKAIIEHTLIHLHNAGFNEIVINVAHLGEQIMQYLGNGNRYGVTIEYTHEGRNGLETAGGIINALPLLKDAPFLVVNGDIATDFPFARIKNRSLALAHVVLVDNPEHHPEGDFGLTDEALVVDPYPVKYTFSGIGVYHPDLFSNISPGINKLAPILREAMAQQQVTGEKYNGFWMDIGTPERLQELDIVFTPQRTTP